MSKLKPIRTLARMSKGHEVLVVGVAFSLAAFALPMPLKATFAFIGLTALALVLIDLVVEIVDAIIDTLVGDDD